MARTRGGGAGQIDLEARLPGGIQAPAAIGADPNAPSRLNLIAKLQSHPAFSSRFSQGIQWDRYNEEDLNELLIQMDEMERRRQEQLEGIRKIDEPSKMRYLQGR
jgi:hypothetical protein